MIREMIQEEIRRQALTRAEVVERAAMPVPALCNYLNGKKQLRGDTLERLFDVLGIELTPTTPDTVNRPKYPLLSGGICSEVDNLPVLMSIRRGIRQRKTVGEIAQDCGLLRPTLYAWSGRNLVRLPSRDHYRVMGEICPDELAEIVAAGEAKGATTKEIAANCGLTVGAIRRHLDG